MKNTDFKNFLFKSAVMAMACDGHIAEEEINAIKKIAANEISFMEYDIEEPLKSNIDYIKADISKRKDKIKSIARKIAKKSASYLSLENDLKYWAKELNSNIHELQAEGMDYPEDFEW